MLQARCLQLVHQANHCFSVNAVEHWQHCCCLLGTWLQALHSVWLRGAAILRWASWAGVSMLDLGTKAG
jgi:hypothetical protein